MYVLDFGCFAIFRVSRLTLIATVQVRGGFWSDNSTIPIVIPLSVWPSVGYLLIIQLIQVGPISMTLTVSFARGLPQLALLKLLSINPLGYAPLPPSNSEPALATLDVSDQHSYSNLAQYPPITCVYHFRSILPCQLLTNLG